MSLGEVTQLRWNPGSDFRAKATFCVAIAAIALLFPVALLDFYQGEIAIGIGSMGIVMMLVLNAWTVYKGQCHQNLTLFGLVPAGMVFMIGVFQNDGVIGSLWCYPSVVACYCMLSERKAWLANLAIAGVCIPMTWVTLEPHYAIRITATMCAVSAFSAIMVHVIDEQSRKLQEQLIRDPLTGLLNRLSLPSRLQQAIDKHETELTPASLLAVDIDLFKRINDTYGHDVGDQVLQQIAQILQDTLRHDDAGFRIGGEEFLILLQGAAVTSSIVIAERIRTAVENTLFANDVSVTVSIGVATHKVGDTWSQWTKSCDRRLYEAKRLGRNTVVDEDTRLVASNVSVFSIPSAIS